MATEKTMRFATAISAGVKGAPNKDAKLIRKKIKTVKKPSRINGGTNMSQTSTNNSIFRWKTALTNRRGALFKIMPT